MAENTNINPEMENTSAEAENESVKDQAETMAETSDVNENEEKAPETSDVNENEEKAPETSDVNENEEKTPETKEPSPEKPKKKKKKSAGSIASRGGSYSLLISVIVLAIMVVINVMASYIPETITKIDITSTKLYSVTSNTKAIVGALEDDVTIYWIVQSGEEDDVIENLLAKYDDLSDHITVEVRNPDVYPTFVANYTDEDAENNSLVVECGERYRYISYDDIYVTTANYTTYTYDYYFDGEGAITSAIDYVTTEDLPMVYILEGHGEDDLPDLFADAIAKENMETSTLTLLNVDEIPEDCDCILIYAPDSDMSEEEADMLYEYVENGGKLLAFIGPTSDGELENFYSVLEYYGVETATGVVVEADRTYYAFEEPYILLPDMASTDITDPLIENNYYPITSIAEGMILTSGADTDAVTEILTTSDESFSKVDGYAMETYDKEDDDEDGPFCVALSIECSNDGEIIWFSTSELLNETINTYSSGANLDLAINALCALVGETDSLSIRSKSLNYSYLTISTATSSQLSIVMIGVLPILFIVIGIVVLVYRRMRRHA